MRAGQPLSLLPPLLLLGLGQGTHCPPLLLPPSAALIPVPFLHIVHSTTWGAGGAADAIGKGIPSVPSLPAALEGGGSSSSAAAADAFSPCTVVDRREEDGSRTVAFEVGAGSVCGGEDGLQGERGTVRGGEKDGASVQHSLSTSESVDSCVIACAPRPAPSPSSAAQGRHIAVFRDVVAVEWRGKRVEGADTVAQIT